MAYEKREIVKITSPKGTFQWPKLSEPDFGTQQYPKPDGEYGVRLLLPVDGAQTKALIAKLQPLLDEAIKSGEAEFKGLKRESREKLKSISVNPFFTVVYDRDTDEPTGDVAFKFSMKAGGERKKGPKAGTRWSRSPAIYDAKGKPMVKVPDIWGGTTGKVSFSIEKGGYFIPGTGAVGIKMALEAAQIIDLVAGGQRSASDHGFGEEEGYEYVEPAKVEDETGDFSDETGTTPADDNAEADF